MPLWYASRCYLEGAVIVDESPGVCPLSLPAQASQAVRAQIIENRNGQVDPTRFPFTFHSPSHPDLLRLRERERLDDIVARAASHFEKVLLLKRWAGQNTRGRAGQRYPTWTAWRLLEQIRRGEDIIVMCGQSAQVFLQACCALGIQARYLEIGNKSNPYCHFLTEVFLEDFDKWAVVDATPVGIGNVYLTREGIPLSALEVHSAYLSGDYDGVVAVHDPAVTDPKHDKGPADILPMYYYFRILFTQDHQTQAPPYFDIENTFDRFEEAIEWEDDLTVPWYENPDSTHYRLPRRRLTRRSASDPADLYWRPTHETEIELRWLCDTTFRLRLRSICPDLDCFLVRLDRAEWQRHPEISAWEPGFGGHVVEARTLTRAGGAGPVASLRFRLSPP